MQTPAALRRGALHERDPASAAADQPLTMPLLDTLVVGRGPAALAAAAALAEAGLRVGVLGPPGPLRWPAEYGAWEDELDHPGLADLVRHRWAEATVGLGGGEDLTLRRPYVRIDKERLAERLLERCDRGDVRWLDGRAVGASHHADRTVVARDGGAEIAARLVVDASGHRPALVQRRATPPRGFQTAFGAVIEYEGPLFPAGRAVLMDWDDAWLPAPERDALPPSFLYALPLGGGRVFVEETVLVARPAVPLKLLEGRLRRRLRALGVRAPRRDDIERCWIPMGGALPDGGQRVVGFGGAAGMVHPATGYMLAATLARAPALAAAVAHHLGAPGADPAHAARSAWRTLWSPERRRRHALHRFGMEALLRLDPPRTRLFFREFFRLPPADWQGYLSDGLPTARLQGTMARLFLNAPGSVRGALARTLLGPAGARLARAVLRPSAG